MATFNLTHRFIELRSMSHPKGFGAALQRHDSLRDMDPTHPDAGLSPEEAALARERAEFEKKLQSLPPEWVELVEHVRRNLATVRQKSVQLRQLHQARLRVSFDSDHAREEQKIEIQSAEITHLFHQSETALKRIASVGGNEKGRLSQQERMSRLNIMRALAVELQNESQAFRNMQKDYFVRLKSQEEVGETYFEDADKKNAVDELTSFEIERLSEDQVQQLKELEQQSSLREKEILRIVQSVSELATMFQELNRLVVEQGTIIDRIDYNVERAVTHVKEGHQQLQKAAEAQPGYRSVICIAVLALICIILFIILIKSKV